MEEQTEFDPQESVAGSQRFGGSFRDPAGYVFQRDDRIFRAVRSDWIEVYRQLRSEESWPQLAQLLVETDSVNDAELTADLKHEHPGYQHFLEHRRLWPITYPYEWSISMLADAALLTLDLQRQLIGAGYSLKDATAYNVQFSGGRPLFIDLTSIERPKRLDLWPALGQFSQMFTYPLMLAVHCGWDLRSYFQSNLSGLNVERVAKAIGFAKRIRPGFWLDVTIPNLLSGRKRTKSLDANELLEQANPDPRPQELNLGRLRGKIASLARQHRPAGHWVEYASTCTYDEHGNQQKQQLVEAFLQAQRPNTVLDLGCNTGTYSLLAARCGAKVIAVDQDPDVVDSLYRHLANEPCEITPLVIDLSNPSPAIGFCNQERPAFLERARCECVLALALVHHLLVTGNLSIPAVRDLLAGLTTRLLVVEYVGPDDPMYAELCKRRVGTTDPLTLENFVEVFSARFETLERHPLPNGRILLMMRKLG